MFVNTIVLIVYVTVNTVINNTFKNYFVRFAKNSGLIKFLIVPLNQTFKKALLLTTQGWTFL